MHEPRRVTSHSQRARHQVHLADMAFIDMFDLHANGLSDLLRPLANSLAHGLGKARVVEDAYAAAVMVGHLAVGSPAIALPVWFRLCRPRLIPVGQRPAGYTRDASTTLTAPRSSPKSSRSGGPCGAWRASGRSQ